MPNSKSFNKVEELILIRHPALPERERGEAGGLCEGKDRNAVYCERTREAGQHIKL